MEECLYAIECGENEFIEIRIQDKPEVIYQFETIIRANTDYARYVKVNDIFTMSFFQFFIGDLRIAPEGALPQSGVRQRATSFSIMVKVDLSCNFLSFFFVQLFALTRTHC